MDSEPPLIPLGPRPLGTAVQSFRNWWGGCQTSSCPPAFNGWRDIAAAQDPLWGCRKYYLLILTDVAGNYCGNINVCSPVASLYAHHNLRTWVVDYGASRSAVAECIAYNSRTLPQYPVSKQELIEALQFVFDEIRASSFVIQ